MITLTTDFGTSDPYVGIMKGVILSTDPSALIVDLTHDIAPQDIAGAGFCLYSACRYFPAGSIHVAVVDPGVGSGRSIIAVSMDDQIFLAPDNGVLGPIISSGTPDSVNIVENDRYFLSPVSRTFHGRDIFAPVAAHLNKGLPPESLGRRINPEDMVLPDIRDPQVTADKRITGKVVAIDRFGNLITNIDYRLVQKIFRHVDERRLDIVINGHSVSGLSDCYQGAGPKPLIAVIGSTGFIEIAVNCGNAAEFCGASRGNTVVVSTT